MTFDSVPPSSSNLSISNTLVADNGFVGIDIAPFFSTVFVKAAFDHVRVYNNSQAGLRLNGAFSSGTINATGYYANNVQTVNASATITNASFLFANLNLVLTANGMMVYCSDCALTTAFAL